jgi:hypothetical protein
MLSHIFSVSKSLIPDVTEEENVATEAAICGVMCRQVLFALSCHCLQTDSTPLGF